MRITGLKKEFWNNLSKDEKNRVWTYLLITLVLILWITLLALGVPIT